MKNNIPLKYACLDNFDNISSKCNDIEIKTLLHELRDLIFYQMREIADQRREVIALKHKEAWKHYDRPIEEYDTEKRAYVDKPAKSGNMSC